MVIRVSVVRLIARNQKAQVSVSADKQARLRAFLDTRRGECGYVPPPELTFVPLAMETHGAVSADFLRLFNLLVRTGSRM